MPNERRYVVFVAVAAAHALVVGVLLGSSRGMRVLSSTGIPLTAFILRRAAHPLTPIPRPRLPAPAAAVVGPVTLPPPPPAITGPASARAIDWEAAARAAAATALRVRKRIAFGFPTGTSPIMRGAQAPHLSAHHAGDTYRSEGGEEIEWVSDRCYVASEPPSLWEPDFLKQARITHTVCLPPDGPPPGELFRNLPAYKKYRPH